MGERERLAIFNMTCEYLPGAVVLDAYAGTGALGLEALSRGAKYVVFIEKSHKVVKTLRENIEKLGVKNNTEVVQGDVNSADRVLPRIIPQNFTSKHFGGPSIRVTQSEYPFFDIIFADPPYDNFNLSDIAHLTEFLKSGGVFVLSHPDDALDDEPNLPMLSLLKTRKYARANISIFQKASD